MGKLTHFVHQSLDGFIHGPNGEFDWPVMGPEMSEFSTRTTDGAVFLYGRVVWDVMSSFWPNAEQYSDHPHTTAYAPIWRKADKVVVSRTLESADWNTRVIRDDVVAELTAIKDSGRDLVLFGGSDLAAFLTEHGVVDEYRVFVHPVILGGGKPAFQPASHRTRIELAGSHVLDGQVVMLHHTRSADQSPPADTEF